MKYSDYARRGYFELVAAAALAGGILVALEYEVDPPKPPVRRAGDRPGRPDDRRPRVGRAPAPALPGRLRLDRAAPVRRRLDRGDGGHAGRPRGVPRLAIGRAGSGTRWWSIGLVSLIVLNLLAPAAFVAERNLARVIDPTLVPPDGEASLDADYLGVLPDDAIPALVAALPSLPAPERVRVLRLLYERRFELSREAGLRVAVRLEPRSRAGQGRARDATVSG